MGNGILPAVALLVLLPGRPGFAQDDQDLRGLLARQGEELTRLREEVDALKDREQGQLEQQIERYLETAKAEERYRPADTRGGLGSRLRLGGYFSLEFRDDGEGSRMEFDQHRLVLKLQAEITTGISFETEIEFEGGGADVDFLDDNEVIVEYAELRYALAEDLFGFKVGILLVPWGRFNRFHDDPLNDLTDRPLVSERIGAVTFGQPGIGAEGTVGFGGGWFLDYDVALVQGMDEDISTGDGARDGRQSFRSDNNENKQAFARIVLAIPLVRVDAFELGASGTHGKYDDLGQHAVYGYGLDLFVKRGPFELVAEYMNLRFDRDASAPPSEPRRMDGWYVECAYHFFPRSWRGAHALFTDESTFTLVVRLESVDLNHATIGAALRDDLGQVTIGFNFRPVERNVFKIGYTFVDSKEAGFEGGSADRFTISWASYF